MTEKNKNQKSKSNVHSLYPRKLKLQITWIFIIVLLFYFYSLYETGADFVTLIVDFDKIINALFNKMLPPNWEYISVAIDPLIETIQIAVVATTFSVLICIPASLMAANTIVKNKFIYQTTRTILNILRTIPDILLATIFVSLFGIGIISGILALTIFSLGLLAKLLSETIETIDPRQLEAIRASGGNIIQVIWYGVVPQVLPQFISYGLYVFELNVRASLVLGFVGAGGIGTIIDTELNFLRYQNVMAILIVLLVAVIIIETISNMLRRRVV
ncbi:phosphonate ABC transporter, permease protein PhnE [Tenuibacillus multivorans]|uniref:Phosphonate transport system permease protein n=1 Tax=Tenuibacillus multivorans TaxID=237069 RepID=A0A1H0A0M7_9BACI|nr:phosphonate ABC transporter, permease protein PhnE [Tenuibacillus multivorans]GEL76905.1 phosphonate ABC transporter permease [Tenuibacillus multivorans]SDN26513.1 phosphonate transport system permease protein [Tenuibacillus multivorans]